MLTEKTLEFANLTQCDRELIQIPAAIQPHGMLMVLREPELTITQASENVGGCFGLSMSDVLGSPLSRLLGAAQSAGIQAAVRNGQRDAASLLCLDSETRLLDGVIHRHDGALILELEHTSADARAGTRNLSLSADLIAIQSARQRTDLYANIVAEVRRLTGYERVVLYKFNDEGDGSVEAESKEASLVSYLGLHYPASDVPKQARQLYLENPLRIIPDARYVPVRIIPAMRTDTGAPLDLTFSVLRSVSGVHLEYMANMGVRAAMSMSLIVQDQLWGLISCANHSGPRLIPYELRAACGSLARVASLQIAAIQNAELEVQRAARRAGLEELVRALVAGPVLEGLLRHSPGLLDVVKATGVAVLRGSTIQSCGMTPSSRAVLALAEWLDKHRGIAMFATSSLWSVFPKGAQETNVASGILTFALPGTPLRRLIWFRPEILMEVNWSGDPRKQAATDPTMRIHPRRSFALWKERVRFRSASWTVSDLECAESLRHQALEIDVEQRFTQPQRSMIP